MTTVTIADLRERLADTLSEVRIGGRTIKVTRRGKVVALIVPAELEEQVDDWLTVAAAERELGAPATRLVDHAKVVRRVRRRGPNKSR